MSESEVARGHPSPGLPRPRRLKSGRSKQQGAEDSDDEDKQPTRVRRRKVPPGSDQQAQEGKGTPAPKARRRKLAPETQQEERDEDSEQKKELRARKRKTPSTSSNHEGEEDFQKGDPSPRTPKRRVPSSKQEDYDQGQADLTGTQKAATSLHMELVQVEKSLAVEPEEEEEDVGDWAAILKEASTAKRPGLFRRMWTEARSVHAEMCHTHRSQIAKIRRLARTCAGELFLVLLLCGVGAFVFRTTEGTFEQQYKCGVKRVKRDFVEELWRGAQYLKEEEWKSRARGKLRTLEEQLGAAFEAGVNSYSGHRSWTFVNSLLYSLSVLTTIGYGHIAPATTTGKALTIVYAVIGIPMFLILLADFGKLFTRGIKWIWAFVRRLYYTGSCRKVRRTGPVQEVMKGVQLVYDIAAWRRPSQVVAGEAPDRPPGSAPDQDTVPPTPAPSNFVIDDEFNLPISLAIMILVLYIFCGAVVFYIWEDWTFFQAFYFVFISMSTIGFGDFVPQHKMYMMASIVYLAFGLALTSMCINVVQEKLSDSFRQASAKIGATIGLKAKEDGVVTPSHVELAMVHQTGQETPTPL